jgi:hypothetical protein
MRVFIAGASGVIGLRLVPLLVAAGDEVAGMTRSLGKVEWLRALGAEPIVCGAFDAGALREAVLAFRPEAVVNELTDLPDDGRLPRAYGVRARGTCSQLPRRRVRHASSLRALRGSCRATQVRKGSSSSPSEGRSLASGRIASATYGPGTSQATGRSPTWFTSELAPQARF